ncbi:MAG: FKBP-type peptidyl-prolyl cis-trans isomerase [Bacteroidales bacterium]|jgi:FKBP-type peptidyl-prolyl cis-trans isomerase|nr:FKBP-type peptidyl-prolyl cis-trans isomerase [Bacteroidales bacterium]
MKKIQVVPLVLLSLTLQAQQTPTTTSATKPGTTQTTMVRLTSKSDTLQYSLGAFIGQWMAKNGFAVTNQVLFKRGMDDVLQNKKLAVTDTTIAPIIAAYQLSTQNARSRQMEEQLFASLKGKPGVGVLPNGVHYIVIKTGTGIRPTAQDSIVINAIGVFPDGAVFEDTFQKKKTITTLTGNLIPGLNETVQLMPEGSAWRIFIPSVLAYGSAGLANVIPPNMALIFDITLMEVKAKK